MEQTVHRRVVTINNKVNHKHPIPLTKRVHKISRDFGEIPTNSDGTWQSIGNIVKVETKCAGLLEKHKTPISR